MKSSETKAKIIETASELFYQKGYNLTGINEIIAEASIAKATLYSHFRSKEEICLAYLRFKHETFLSELAAFCEARKKGKAQIIGIFDFLSSFFQGKDFNGCWCLRTIAEIPKENEKIREEIQKEKNEFLDFICNLIKKNGIRSTRKQIEILAKQIYLLYESAVAESHLHQEDWPIEAAKKMAMAIL